MPFPRLAPLLSLLVAVSVGSAADWSNWRGPGGMGHTDDKQLPLTWNAKTSANVRWKVELPLQGPEEVKSGVDQNQSSPIVRCGRVFVTVSHWSGKTDPKQHPEHHVVCYQAVDGKLLWNENVGPGPWLLADLRGATPRPHPPRTTIACTSCSGRASSRRSTTTASKFGGRTSSRSSSTSRSRPAQCCSGIPSSCSATSWISCRGSSRSTRKLVMSRGKRSDQTSASRTARRSWP